MDNFLSSINNKEELPNKSEIILKYYQKLPKPEGFQYFRFRISEYFDTQKENYPLIIRHLQGDELQCMLAYWIEEQRKKNKELIIPYFVDHESGNYYQAIYHILIKLKMNLSINQKVELEGEKLKQYFDYWLSVAGRELQNSLFGEGSINYKRITIVIDGVNKFRDSTGEIRINTWLPKIFPENVRMILTTIPDSKAYKYYENLGLQIMPVDTEMEELFEKIHHDKIINAIYNKLSDNLKCEVAFLQCCYMILSNKAEDFQLIFQELCDCTILNTEEEFYQILISTFLNCFNEPGYQQILQVLSYVQYGITQEEILQTCQLEKSNYFNIIYLFFQPLMIECKSIYWIANLKFKQVLTQFFQYNKKLMNQYLSMLEHSQSTIRRLEERIYQYNKNKSFFKLKEVVINIENFFILWNLQHKFEICNILQILELHGYDLVLEYNRSVENYLALYKSSNETIFFIMIQICKLMREFSNFENTSTPVYKHPPLIGQTIEFEEIGLYKELSQLKMISKKKKNFKPVLNEDYFIQKKEREKVTLAVLETINIDIQEKKKQFIEFYDSQLDADLVSQYLQNRQQSLLDKILEVKTQQQHYYYKRWIWIQFPWLALTSKFDFSNLIQNYQKNGAKFYPQLEPQGEGLIDEKKEKRKTKQLTLKQLDLNKKLPEISPVRIRTLSPSVEAKVERKFYFPIKQRDASEEKRYLYQTDQRSPQSQLNQKLQKQKYDQLFYKNKVLKKKLLELQTVQQSMQPCEEAEEYKKTLNSINQQQEEYQKLSEQLQQVNQSTKRLQIVLKICSNNSDYNEQRAQVMGKHSKNLDKVIEEFKQQNKDLIEKLLESKSKIKQETKKSKLLIDKQQKKQEITLQQKYPSNLNLLVFQKQMKSSEQLGPKSPILQSPSRSPFKSSIFLKTFRSSKGMVQEIDLTEQAIHQYLELVNLGLLDSKTQENLEEFKWKQQKQVELSYYISENSQKLREIQKIKEDKLILLKVYKNIQNQKILQKSTSNLEQSIQLDPLEEKQIYENKVQQLKQNKHKRAGYRFCIKSLIEKLSSIQPIKITNLKTLKITLIQLQNYYKQ